ncbi:hypothetical protein [Chrysiogenes arsenatis]|uniref:hypothetical protein n=1 Tax=Chrysiogenes arsenatis TaxID=309797 RepID=UPI0004223FAD|nr:hypothetical protein [Chrysiogenes arsenatis]
MAEAITVNGFRSRLAACVAGGPALPPVAFMAFGDGGHNADLTPKAPSAAATALNHEVLRKPLALISLNGYEVEGKGVVEKAELIGVRISEAALLDAQGNVVGLKFFAPKVKEGDERYEISIVVRF